MTIDDVISRLRKKKELAKPVGPMDSLFQKLTFNIVGAMADIAQIFADRTGKTEIVGRPRVEVTNFPKMKMAHVDLQPLVAAVNKLPKQKEIDFAPVIAAIRNIPKTEKFPGEINIKNQVALDKVESLLSQLVRASSQKTSSKSKDDTLVIKELRSLFEGLSEAVLSAKPDSVRVSNPGDFPVSPAKAAYHNSKGEVSEGLVDDDKHVQVDVLTMPGVTLETGDIEIGAIEIKDHDSDTRANVGANGLEVDVKASALPTGAATSAKQDTGNSSLSNIDTKLTDGSQKSQIVDAGGEAVTVTDGKLDVNATLDTTGLATEAKQDIGNASLSSIDTKIDALTTPSDTQPVSNAGLTELAGAIDGTEVQVDVVSSALPTGAATAANQATANEYLSGIAGLTPTAFDYVALSYTGTNLTGVVFKTGGSGGTTIATLVLAYTGSRLDTVTKT